MQSWCRTWLPNGTQSYPCKNENFSGNAKGLAKVLGADEATKSHLHWQFIGIWQILWRSSMESSNFGHLIDLRQMVLLRERYAEWMKGTSAVSLQSGLDEKWWADSMECCCYLRNVQDLKADGKTPYERRFGESFKGPTIPSSALVEYLPNSERDKARIYQFGKKVLQESFQDMLWSRGEFGKEIFWLLILKN